MRSLIVAPPEERRLAAARMSGAGAVIVDLALSPASEKAAARAAAARFLKEARSDGGPALIAGIHGLDSGETDADLDAVMGSAPDAILLPGSIGAASVQELAAKLAVKEADFALTDGATRIIAVADSARGLFNLASYRDASARLAGLSFGATSLRADIGAEAERDPSGGLLGAFRLARDLTLLAAAAADVVAIDAAFAVVGDPDGLRAEALAARRDGFSAKLAVDPAQPRVINEAFLAARGRPLRIRPIGDTDP